MIASAANLSRRLMRAIRSDRARVGAFGRAWRFGVMLEPFAAAVALLRLRSLRSGPLIVEGETFFGARVRCHLPDMIQLYIHQFGWWEPDLTNFLAGRLREGDVVVDVGANAGYVTLLASATVGATGRVVAIEASPRMAGQLRANLALNGPPGNVRVVHAAASDRTGTLPIYAGPEKNLGLTTGVQGRGFRLEAEVPAAPLGDLLQDEEIERARIVKIDVEGGEVTVLRGLVPLLKRLPPTCEIVVELSPAWWEDPTLVPEDVLRDFRDAGYRAYELKNNYWPWRYLWPRDWQRPRRITRPLTGRPKRIEVVLSRVDADRLD